MGRYGFLSHEWLGALEQTAQRLLDKTGSVPGRPVGYAEIFTDVPAEVKVAAGYILAFDDGKASVVAVESADEKADCCVRVDYSVALTTMRFSSGPELETFVKNAFAKGLMSMSGSPKDLPINMSDLHDALIEQTEI